MELEADFRPPWLRTEEGDCEMAKKKANIPTAENVTVVSYPPRRSILDLLVRRSQEDVLDVKLRSIFRDMPFHAWMQGGFLRMMPFWISVK